jgi:Icc protein
VSTARGTGCGGQGGPGHGSPGHGDPVGHGVTHGQRVLAGTTGEALLAEAVASGVEPEVTTVADDEVVVHVPARPGVPAAAVRFDGLAPARVYRFGPVEVRTLPRPPGERLATLCTVNDLHFGEQVAGLLEGLPESAGLRCAPGEPPYPETMNDAAVAEVSALAPDLVVAKGDLTDSGRPEEFAAFRRTYEPAFAGRLAYCLGNHDVARPNEPLAPAGATELVLPGLIVALLETAVPGEAGGRLDTDQLEWLDELAARADRPVLVLGHHHAFDPGSRRRPASYFGIAPEDSEALVGTVARRPAIVAYAAGHTHRNRVRRFAATGEVPFVEVACVKDFPGSFAEYRVFEGGILQVHRRLSTPEALSWSERCRALYDGVYPAYAFGTLADRCFPIHPRR